MARKNIFDIASDSLNISNETDRIMQLFCGDKILHRHRSSYTIKEYFQSYLFEDWKWRGHFIDVDDFLNSIEYDSILDRCEYHDIESFLTLIELVYNFWEFVNQDLMRAPFELICDGNFYHLKKILQDDLQQLNYTIYNCDERVLVIEGKPEVTAVAEVVEPPLALDVIKYNHHSIQGEIELKKAILLSLGAELEPRRKDLQLLNKQLSEDIFFMLNNINIRHNNISQKDKYYREYVANLSKEELEKWYDELYQMMLLAILLLDNMGRTTCVKELKAKVTEEGT